MTTTRKSKKLSSPRQTHSQNGRDNSGSSAGPQQLRAAPARRRAARRRGELGKEEEGAKKAKCRLRGCFFFFFSSSVVVIRASAFFFSAPVVPCSLFDSSNRLDGDAASLCQRERNRGAKFLPETCRKRRRRRRSRRSTMTSCGGGGKKNQLSPPFYLSLPRLLHSRRSSQINDYVNDGFDAFDK